MNETLRFEAAQDRLNALHAEAEQYRQVAQAPKEAGRHPNFWQRTWQFGHWHLAVRLSQGS